MLFICYNYIYWDSMFERRPPASPPASPPAPFAAEDEKNKA
jgi:hypothetical protein